ncbi:MAG: hypothetical protein A3J65_02210 [Candidatus Buchananbacteria bacterium RIFCSPHIGHO2_02_FULL_45_11b]|uniref:Uncharacterized protein n=1 Tax=Candidatus Buchananbacteria bacterium RIFCSPHIGHO2_02_FULL_45_11b TaxID=1797541 RepID=A0A1G1YHT3_9BACT|nr:MAG: hypothetical protein A3J65_02210 [Candidatus Buchananbacteria bacterium RIFCSPHIGHO2_02_FULL_45_11b]
MSAEAPKERRRKASVGRNKGGTAEAFPSLKHNLVMPKRWGGFLFGKITERRKIMENQETAAAPSALETAINGQCPMCGQTRIRKQVPFLRIGFQPSTTKTFIICGNQACSNYGKS